MKKLFFSIFIFLNFTAHTTTSAIEFDESDSHTCFTIENVSELHGIVQTAIWLDEETIAIGKWDGSITILRYDEKLSIVQIVIPPQKGPVTALTKINDNCFVSSNGLDGLIFWNKKEDQCYHLYESYQFDENYGFVDSAILIHHSNDQKLLTGHSNGYLLVWNFQDGRLELATSIDLRSNNPVDSPYPLWNIRKIVLWRNGSVITASEDGDLCIVDYLNHKLIHRQRYNQSAKRGINDIEILGDFLLVSNCSVGSLDKNLWLYHIDIDGFTYLDSANLVSNSLKEQVFSFQVGLLPGNKHNYFLCTTGEGLLWYGTIKNNMFEDINFKENSLVGGAALAIHPTREFCVSANYDIKIMKFKVN